MTSPRFVVLRLARSGFGERLVARLRERGHQAEALALDAASESGAVTVADDAVRWEGVELWDAAAVFVERPAFAWPQPAVVPSAGSDAQAWARAVHADREARALAGSALRAVADRLPVANDPQRAVLAAAPALALERLAAAGVATAPWRLEPSGESPLEAGELLLDAAGGDRWHAPGAPAAGEPALVLSIPGPVDEVLVVGDRGVAARRYADGRTWAAGEGSAHEADAETGAAALRAAAALRLDWAVVALSAQERRVVRVAAAPDLEAWEGYSEGRAADAIAEHLVTRAENGGIE